MAGGIIREEVIGRATLFHADCVDVLTRLPDCWRPSAIITDPPYPDYLAEEFAYDEGVIKRALDLDVQQFVFWSATADFPLDWSAIHIWHKPNGQSVKHYERIFERHGGSTCKVFRVAAILPNYTQFAAECVDHPTQKPLKLVRDLVCRVKGEIVFDPFMGSGTTGVATTQAGKKFVGVERDERFFDIACKRIEDAQRQGDMFIGAAA